MYRTRHYHISHRIQCPSTPPSMHPWMVSRWPSPVDGWLSGALHLKRIFETTYNPTTSLSRERDRHAGIFSSSPQVNPSDRRSLPFHPVSRILICGMPRLLHLYHSPDVQCWDFSGVVGRPRQGGWKRQCRDKEAKKESKFLDFNS